MLEVKSDDFLQKMYGSLTKVEVTLENRSKITFLNLPRKKLTSRINCVLLDQRKETVQYFLY